MGIVASTRIPCVVQVGHHYSAPLAQHPIALDNGGREEILAKIVIPFRLDTNGFCYILTFVGF